MKFTEIPTTQNVVILYPLATLTDRLLAFLIDLLITAAAGLVILLIFLTLGVFRSQQYLLVFITVLPVFLFYHLAMEAFFGGRSFGKRIMKIIPVKRNGEPMAFFDYLLRWIFRLPDILLSSGALAMIMIYSTSASQRLGDFLANTVVIKDEDSHKPDINRMLKMNEQQKKYTPRYTEVRHLTEKDIFTIREVIIRNETLKNEASLMALEELIEKIEIKLQIKAGNNKLQFLKDLVNDYIFLTR